MTTVAPAPPVRTETTAAGAAPEPTQPPPVPPGRGQQLTPLAAAGISMSILAVLILGFVVYLVGISSVQESHNQLTAYNKLRAQLDGATAPVGPVAPGTPVAILDIPAIGIKQMVVIEGTAPGNLMHGPGLRVDTPLPGQSGVSVIYGRRATFGGPFSKVPSLHVGDLITATTGQGVAKYRVTKFSTGGQPVHDTAPNRLVLTTADSSFVPDRSISVSAELEGTPQPGAPGYPAATGDQRPMSNDTSVTLLLMVWCVALLLVAAGGTAASIYWARWPAWILASPVLFAVVWNIYENAAHLLPNLF